MTAENPRATHLAPRTGCAAGFTLMELVVVIAILSLVAVIVLPKLPSTEASDLRRSARQLAATIRYTQDKAVTGKIPLRMKIEAGTGTITISRLTTDGEERTGESFLDRPVLAGSVVVGDVVTPRGGKRSDGETVVDFGPGGIGQFTVIHLKSAKGSYFTVMAYPTGGKVKVFEGYLEEAQ